jgi:hypothetical protein
MYAIASVDLKDFVAKQVWIDVNTELPPDRWTGPIKVRFSNRVSEMECLSFQEKNPAIGAENDFAYQTWSYGWENG